MIIWGNTYNFELIGNVPYECPGCKTNPCSLYWARNKFSLYFIPLFTTSTSYAVGCSSCNQHWLLEKGVGDELLAEIL